MNRQTFLKFMGLSTLSFGLGDLNQLKNLTDDLASTAKMPVLFLGHGSPVNAIEENIFVKGFRTVAEKLPRPQAILCISAHWYIQGTKLTAMEYPKTIYDFGGFPPELYQVKYPAKGSPSLAKETAKLLEPVVAHLDHQWGLDHGAWTVIKHLYPAADVPVIQMSIDNTKPAQYHFELAKQLSSLRRKGIMIIGSGNIVHNLGLVDWQNLNKVDYGYDWAIEARSLVNQWIVNGDYQQLIDYHKLGKAINLAVPSPDHYLPLIYALGLKEKDDSIDLFNDKLLAGSLSMTSVKIG